MDTVDDEVLDAISSQFLFQLGFLLILPIPLLLAVEQVIFLEHVINISKKERPPPHLRQTRLRGI